MKKRLLAILLCLVLVVCVLAACGEEAHVHTFSETWSNDAQGHWYEPTCDCEDAPILKYNHADKNNDGACDVCEYASCDHTYSEDWTADCTNHWNAASCGHIVAGVNFSEHIDSENDGRCDVCNYIIVDIHEHYYSTEWTSDGEYHWHAALCEHGVEVADKAAHEINDAGYCMICDAKVFDVDMTSIEAVLKAAVANNYKVLTGSVLHNQIVYNGSEPNALVLLAAAKDDVYFVLGNEQSYFFIKDYNADGDLIGGEQQWFERISENEIFGCKMDVNGYVLDEIDGDPAKLNGYNYLPGDILQSKYENTTTLAETLYNFYDLMTNENVNEGHVSNVVMNYDAETGAYTFSYTYWAKNEVTSGGTLLNRDLLLCEVEVEFYVNEDFVINYAKFQNKQYAYTNEGNTENDLIYTTDENGNETVIKSDNANPTYYTYEVFQTSGERTFTTPYPKESLIPVGFEFYHVTEHDFPEAYQWEIISETLLGDSITVQEGEYVYFRLGNPIPSFASFNFIDTEDFEFYFENLDPNSTAKAWYMTPGSVDEMLNGYSAYIGCLKIKMRDPGEYTMTIKLAGITKQITLIIEGEKAPELDENTESTINVATTDTYIWDVDKYTYTATKSGTYTFELPAGLGIVKAGRETPDIDFYDNLSGATTSYYIAEGETLEFYIAAASKDVWVINVSYAEGGTPDSDGPGGNGGGNQGGTSGAIVLENIAGTYNAGSNVLVINTDGTMTYTAGSVTYNYTITISGSTVSYSLNGNAAYTAPGGMSQYFGYIIFDENGMPASWMHNAKETALTPAGGSGDEGGDDIGGGDIGGGEEEQPTLQGSGSEFDPYVIPATGKYTCAFPGGGSSIWYAYTVTADGFITISSTFEAAWLQLGTDAYSASMNSNGGNGQPVKLLAKAGQTVIFGVADWDEQVVNVEFTVAFEAAELKDISSLAGNWVGFETNDFGGFAEYGVVINADGTGKGYQNPGEGQVYFAITGITYIGNEVYITITDAYDTEDTIIFVYDETIMSLVSERGMNWGTLELYATEDAVEFDNELPPVYDNTVVIGENLLWFSEDEVAANTANRNLYIVFGGTYALKAGNLYITAVVDAEGNVIESDIYGNYILAEGTYTVTFSDLSVYGVEADTVQYLYVVESIVEDEGGEDIGGGDEDTTTEEQLNIGPNYINFANINFVYTAPVNGTLKLDIGTAMMGMVSVTYTVNGSEPQILELESYVELALNAGDVVYVYVEAEGAATLGAIWTESEVVSNDKELVLDNNQIEQADVNFHYTATEAGKLTLTAGGAIMGMVEITYTVNNGEAQILELSSTVVLDLVAGDKVVVIVKSEGYSSITASFAKNAPVADGSSKNPFVIESLPYSVTYEGKHEFYYTFTADKDMTLVIHYSEGGLVSDLPEGWTKDTATLTYTVPLTSGQTMKIYLWTMREAGTFIYTFEEAVAAEPETPDEPEQPGEGGEDGGETTGILVYISEENGGRRVKFEIDKANGTMVVTRTNMSNTFDGTVGTTYSYSYDPVTKTVTIVADGYTSFTGITFDENGAPTYAAYFGVAYTNYTLQ